MDSIKDIFKIGVGPSSSHTMGPRRAAERFLAQYPQAARFQVTLYGSLAATGKGHLTDQAILAILGASRTEICWEPTVFLPFHPNGMRFRALSEGGEELGTWEVYSIGGGQTEGRSAAAGQRYFRLPLTETGTSGFFSVSVFSEEVSE